MGVFNQRPGQWVAQLPKASGIDAPISTACRQIRAASVLILDLIVDIIFNYYLGLIHECKL